MSLDTNTSKLRRFCNARQGVPNRSCTGPAGGCGICYKVNRGGASPTLSLPEIANCLSFIRGGMQTRTALSKEDWTRSKDCLRKAFEIVRALKWVAKIFEGRAEFVDETVEIIGDEMPAKDYAQIISRVLKRKTTYNHVPREMHSSMGFPGSCELADMFEFLRLLPSRRAHLAMPRAFLRRCRRLKPG